MDLSTFFKEHNQVALGFSGGVDSSYLLYAGQKYGARVQAYFIKSEFQPDFELEDARRLARDVGAAITVIHHSVLENGDVTRNPADRCYHCKRALFGLLKQRAAADGFSVLIDGTNASDDAGDRPGMKALGEMQVLSPLRLCGITKEDVRRLSREAGLFTWDKPSYACLATRVPTGTEITGEILRRVEKAEDALFALGFSDFRVRYFSGAARLQLPENQLPRAMEQRPEITRQLSPYFPHILLDLIPRNH